MTSSLNVIDVADLAPLREALLQRAHADADKALAEADQDVADVNAAATAQATQLMDQAKAQAAEDIAVLEAAERSRVLREARSIQLQARRAAYDALVAAVSVAVRAQLADDPAVVAGLTQRARAELGADALLSRLPDGGLVAVAGGRRLTLPLQALVERAVAERVAAAESP